MEEYSNTSVWELLKIMQRKVKDNALLIQKNVKSVDIVKLNYTPSEKRNKIINSIYKRNIELTAENTTLLNLHNTLYKFYNQFKNILCETSNNGEGKVENGSEGESWSDYREACMEKSISGELQINGKHPFINDQEFFNDLMIQCQNLELYERCSEIVNVKSKIKISS